MVHSQHEGDPSGRVRRESCSGGAAAAVEGVRVIILRRGGLRVRKHQRVRELRPEQHSDQRGRQHLEGGPVHAGGVRRRIRVAQQAQLHARQNLSQLQEGAPAGEAAGGVAATVDAAVAATVSPAPVGDVVRVVAGGTSLEGSSHRLLPKNQCAKAVSFRHTAFRLTKTKTKNKIKWTKG